MIGSGHVRYPPPPACPRSADALANSRRAQLPRELVEHGIDHAGFLRVDEGAGDIDVFRRHHPRRHVAAAGKLVGAGPQHRAQHRLDALERPAARQRGVDLRIEPCLLAHDAADDVAEKCRLRRPILRALDIAAEPMAFELGQNLVQAGAGKVHLVERLHGGEPRRAALVGLARLPSLRVLRRRGSCHRPASRRLMSTSASAARAASPPLSCSSGRARASACASVSTVMMPLPIGSARAIAISISPRAD